MLVLKTFFSQRLRFLAALRLVVVTLFFLWNITSFNYIKRVESRCLRWQYFLMSIRSSRSTCLRLLSIASSKDNNIIISWPLKGLECTRVLTEVQQRQHPPSLPMSGVQCELKWSWTYNCELTLINFWCCSRLLLIDLRGKGFKLWNAIWNNRI